MKHINGNKVCAIGFRVTGPVAGLHELIELAVLPMNNTSYDRSILPFNMRIRMERPHLNTKTMANKTLPLYLTAQDQQSVAQLFEYWYKKLGLHPNKRIIPLGYNLHILWPFLIDLFSYSPTGENFVEDFFDFSQARSLNQYSHYWNDLAWTNQEQYPFHKHDLTYLAFRLGILYEENRTTLGDAVLCAKVWAQIIHLMLPTGVDLPINYPRQIDYSSYDEVADDEADGDS